ncbi:MAG: CDP-glucose 4,6-dehydratase [Cyclobacteriaceae bacterium]
MDPSFFTSKKIFLTGHTGFKGSWLLSIFKALGANVKGYSLRPEGDSLYNTIHGDKLCDSEIGDILNYEQLKKSVESFNPDFIFHFAAQPLVLKSYRDPKYTFDVNVAGTVNILETFRLAKKKMVFVAVTTDKVYKNETSNYPFRESDELGGHDPYSSSKAGMEMVLDSYLKSYILSKTNKWEKGLVTCRAGNVIGGGDFSEDRIIPDIFRALSYGKKLVVRNPNSVRPWQHVLDALNGYLHAAYHTWLDPINFSQPFNFGPDPSEIISVHDLVKTFSKGLEDLEYTIQAEYPEKAHEAPKLLLDNYLARNRLRWKPIWEGYNAIKYTLEWYKKYHQNPSDNLTMEQVDNFFRDFKKLDVKKRLSNIEPDF